MITPINEETVESDPRFHLRSMFRLVSIHENGDRHYQCLSCLPKPNYIWTSPTTNQHLEKHVKSRHPSLHSQYQSLVASKICPKKCTSLSTSLSTSQSSIVSITQSQHSVSKRLKKSCRDSVNSNTQPIKWGLYSQANFEEDTVTEVIMNMLPFDVSELS